MRPVFAHASTLHVHLAPELSPNPATFTALPEAEMLAVMQQPCGSHSNNGNKHSTDQGATKF